MLSAKFGIEIEFTGITRERAARVAAEFLQGIYSEGGTYYDTKKVKTSDGRVWKFMYDGSINCQRKEGRRKVAAGAFSFWLIALTSSFLFAPVTL
jgi:hypothetical protein